MRVDTEVETTVWAPIKGSAPSGAIVCFVDGVMRAEEEYTDNPLMSFAAGAVALRTGMVNPAEESLIAWEVKRSVRASQETAYNLLRDLEAEVISKVCGEDFDLLIKDGTVDRAYKCKIPVAGLIKDIQKIYIPHEKREILSKLKKGERTPLFLIEAEEDRIDRLSWFVKLTDAQNTSDLARLEVEADSGLENAVKVADLSAGLLPAFASDPLRDPRAPQNLLPIGWLEKRLRSLMGDSRLIRRSLLTSQGPQ